MVIRPRRNRKSAAIRAMVAENQLSVDHLIYPLFVMEGEGQKEAIGSLPGQYRYSSDELLREVEACRELGLECFILFPKVPEEKKDKEATYSYAEDNFYLKAAAALKAAFPEICLISDVALDPYNIDGHDGLVRGGKVLNDESVEVLCRMSLAQAQAGFDILGPSDMMDGRVGAMRQALDGEGFQDTGIMSYTAKYASAFYGPFRDALDSAPVEGAEVPRDKSTYQMDPANRQEALREALLDEAEGADFLMVKPALHYLDVIAALKATTPLPIAAYHVSGEYAMLKAACINGWLDYEQAMPETLLCLRRAGTDAIITYFAKDFAEWLLR